MVGTVVVCTIVVTSLFNAWPLIGVGNVTNFSATLNGRLLLTRLALFIAMLGLASFNRFRLTPVFERSVAAGDHTAAIMTLRLSLAVEAASAVLILLGRLAWDARTACGDARLRK